MSRFDNLPEWIQPKSAQQEILKAMQDQYAAQHDLDYRDRLRGLKENIPTRVLAADVYLNEEGITIEATNGTKILIPVNNPLLIKRMEGLIIMTQLAKMLPEDNNSSVDLPAQSGT